jgi:hypothetical protein
LAAERVKQPLCGNARKAFRDKKIAGEGIRTLDVQLGNSVLGAQTLVRKALTSRFLARNEDYN